MPLGETSYAQHRFVEPINEKGFKVAVALMVLSPLALIHGAVIIILFALCLYVEIS